MNRKQIEEEILRVINELTQAPDYITETGQMKEKQVHLELELENLKARLFNLNQEENTMKIIKENNYEILNRIN